MADEGRAVRRGLLAEDWAIIFHWAALIVMLPTVLLPIFSIDFPFSTRIAGFIALFPSATLLTYVYVYYRNRSMRRARHALFILAGVDTIATIVALTFWPEYLPDSFWVLTVILVLVVAQFELRWLMRVTLALFSLYLVTVLVNLQSAGSVSINGIPVSEGYMVISALVRIMFALMIVVGAAGLSRKGRQQRRIAELYSRITAAINATSDRDELREIVVNGIAEVSGLETAVFFLLDAGNSVLRAAALSVSDERVVEQILGIELAVAGEPAVMRAVGSRRAAFPDAEELRPLTSILSPEGPEGMGALMLLPFIDRGELRGLVLVEAEAGRKGFDDWQVRICRSIIGQAAVGFEGIDRFDEEAKMRAEADVLYRTSRELGSTLELEMVLENACRLVMMNTGASGSAAFLSDPKSDTLIPKVMLGAGTRNTNFPTESGIRRQELDDACRLIGRSRALLVENPSEHPLLPPFLSSYGVVAFAPFYSRGSLAGALCIFEEDYRRFDIDQVDRLALIANETALAVINAQLHDEMRRHATQMASMVQFTNAVGSSTELTSILELGLESMRELFECSAGIIYRIDEDSGKMSVIASFGYTPEEIEEITDSGLKPVELCQCYKSGELVAENVITGGHHDCDTLRMLRDGTSMCASLRAGQKTLGILHLWSENPSGFSETDQQVALAFADQVGLALQRALLFEEINRLAITDPLTGVYNTRRLQAALKDEMERARRYGRPVSFLMIDVDNLKMINDVDGHQAGDQVLAHVASVIGDSLRHSDMAFRYGGDEFSVLLPETDAPEAAVVAEKIRRSIAESTIVGERYSFGDRVTVSIGSAAFPQDASDGKQLVRVADSALYRAKRAGRNRTTPAS